MKSRCNLNRIDEILEAKGQSYWSIENRVVLRKRLEMIFENEGYRLMGAAFEVYNELGYGLSEEIYQQSLEVELDLRQIAFLRKPMLDVFYKGRKLEALYIPDLFVSDAIVVELKAVSDLCSEHAAPLFNYLRVGRLAT